MALGQEADAARPQGEVPCGRGEERRACKRRGVHAHMHTNRHPTILSEQIFDLRHGASRSATLAGAPPAFLRAQRPNSTPSEAAKGGPLPSGNDEAVRCARQAYRGGSVLEHARRCLRSSGGRLNDAGAAAKEMMHSATQSACAVDDVNHCGLSSKKMLRK